MGYRLVDADDVELAEDRPCDMRRLSDAVGLSAVAMNRFTPAPGEQLPLAYHYHDEQEEAFYVLDGTLRVETPAETYELGPDDLMAIDPESPQRAYCPADAAGPADVLAIGVPPVTDDARPYDPEDAEADAAGSGGGGSGGSDGA